MIITYDRQNIVIIQTRGFYCVELITRVNRFIERATDKASPVDK
jgi:hypothetical protein